MKKKAQRKREIDAMRKMASADTCLLDMLDFAEKTSRFLESTKGVESVKVLMPYVSAPMLTERAWK